MEASIVCFVVSNATKRRTGALFPRQTRRSAPRENHNRFRNIGIALFVRLVPKAEDWCYAQLA